MTAAILFMAASLPAIVDQKPAGAAKVLTPGTRMRNANTASMSAVAWVDANGWRLRRNPGATHSYENVPANRLPLALAEGYVYGGNAAILTDAATRPVLEPMVKFIQSVDAPPMPPVGDVFVVDDGSPMLGEILNLMSRRNLCYHAGPAPSSSYPVVVKVGEPDFPKTAATNPGAFAYLVRKKLTDEKRSLRIYGSEVVVGHLTAAGPKARLHLLNYATDPIESFRVRVLGDWKIRSLRSYADPDAAVEEIERYEGGTEFGITRVTTYAVIDLERP